MLTGQVWKSQPYAELYLAAISLFGTKKFFSENKTISVKNYLFKLYYVGCIFRESVAEIICTSHNHVVAVIAIGRQWNYSTKLSNNVHQYKINDTISHPVSYTHLTLPTNREV